MTNNWLMFLIGFAVAGIMFQFLPSADLFDKLEFSEKSVIKHGCGGYTKEGHFEWYNIGDSK